MTHKDSKQNSDTKKDSDKTKNELEQESASEIVLKEAKKDYELENKREEVLQLEEQEKCLKLEFFSREELCSKIEELKETLKERDESLKKITLENDNSKSKFMHLQAEFENAQKRWYKNRQELRTQYTASVLKNFLSLYDSFKKALENDPENQTLKSFFNQFLNIFKSYQAEPIDVNINDSFDYSIHEALSSIEKDNLPENSIIDIIQDGWKIGKDVLRYTKVVISKKPKPPEAELEKEKSEVEEDSEKSEEENLENNENSEKN